MIEEVDDAGGQAGHRTEAYAQHHVADLGDRGIGEQPFEIGLVDRHCGCGENPNQCQRQQQPVQAHGLKGEIRPEYGKHKAQKGVYRHLGGRSGDEGRDHRGRVSVGVRQPDVEGKQRQLQGPAHHVEQPDADQNKRSADGAEDQVVVGRSQCAPVASETDQTIGRE